MSIASAAVDNTIVEVGDRQIVLVQTPADIYFSLQKGDEVTAEICVPDASVSHAVWRTLLAPSAKPQTFRLTEDTIIIRDADPDVELEIHFGHDDQETRILRFPKTAVRSPDD